MSGSQGETRLATKIVPFLSESLLGTQMGRQVANMFVADDPGECAFPTRDLKPVRSKRVMEGASRFVLQPLARLRSRFL